MPTKPTPEGSSHHPEHTVQLLTTACDEYIFYLEQEMVHTVKSTLGDSAYKEFQRLTLPTDHQNNNTEMAERIMAKLKGGFNFLFNLPDFDSAQYHSNQLFPNMHVRLHELTAQWQAKKELEQQLLLKTSTSADKINNFRTLLGKEVNGKTIKDIITQSHDPVSMRFFNSLLSILSCALTLGKNSAFIKSPWQAQSKVFLEKAENALKTQAPVTASPQEEKPITPSLKLK